MPPWDSEPAAPATPHALLHHLWSKALETPDYDKTQWKALEQHFWRLCKAPSEAAEDVATLRKALAQAQADVIACQEVYAAARKITQAWRDACADIPAASEDPLVDLMERLAKAVGL